MRHFDGLTINMADDQSWKWSSSRRGLTLSSLPLLTQHLSKIILPKLPPLLLPGQFFRIGWSWRVLLALQLTLLFLSVASLEVWTGVPLDYKRNKLSKQKEEVCGMRPRFLLTCKRGRAQKKEKEARSLPFLLRPRLVQQPARGRLCPSPVHAFSTCHLEKLWLHMPLGGGFTVGPHSSCHSWSLISSLLSKLSFSFEAT